MTTLVVITEAGNVFGFDVANTTVEPVFEFRGATIGFNSQDRFMVTTGDTLLVTNNRNVFGAKIDAAGEILVKCPSLLERR